MGLVYQAMQYYPYVVHPITILGASLLVLIHHEWELQETDRSTLRRRIGAFVGVGFLALLPTATYFLVTGQNPITATQGNHWRMDALVASGLFIVAGLLWYLWRRFDWGPEVPGAMQALAIVTVPYIALSPFWNVSGHVILSLMPTLYLTLVDRTFWPSLVLPAIMIPNRIILDAHTWTQTIGAVVLTAVLVLGVYWVQTDGSFRPEPESTAL